MMREIVIFHYLLQYRVKTSRHDNAESSEDAKSGIIPENQNKVSDIDVVSLENKTESSRNSFLSILGIFLGIAAVITLVLANVNQPSLGTSTGLLFLKDGSSSSNFVAPATGAFSFHALGYTVVLPQYPPGYAFNYLPYELIYLHTLF